MSFSFRKTLKIGSKNINIGTTGKTFSVGMGGSRISKTSGNNIRTDISLPNKGLRLSKNFKLKNK